MSQSINEKIRVLIVYSSGYKIRAKDNTALMQKNHYFAPPPCERFGYAKGNDIPSSK